ncbi:MAG TPA: chemotaxis protein CheW [Burkholderiales bacterium]|nr:chemotaxis protein CheW [Burkholderiales bacterium]
MGSSAVTTTGRISLREYQLALSERLQNAEAGAALPSKLGFQVAGEGWLIELRDAAEVIEVPPISPVPLARGWFKGVANVRGNLYSVSDFSAFLGAEPVKLGAEARLLVLSERFRCGAALLIERSLGLRALGALVPESVAAPAPWVRAQYSDAEGRRWKELDVAALVQQEPFLGVSA